jgi:hypothetical protein
VSSLTQPARLIRTAQTAFPMRPPALTMCGCSATRLCASLTEIRARISDNRTAAERGPAFGAGGRRGPEGRQRPEARPGFEARGRRIRGRAAGGVHDPSDRRSGGGRVAGVAAQFVRNCTLSLERGTDSRRGSLCVPLAWTFALTQSSTCRYAGRITCFADAHDRQLATSVGSSAIFLRCPNAVIVRRRRMEMPKGRSDPHHLRLGSPDAAGLCA